MNTMIDKLVEMSSDFARSQQAARELDPRLANELEKISTSLVQSVRACIDLNQGLAQMGDGKLNETQVQLVINAAYAEYTDAALGLWDRYKDVWLLESCWRMS